MNNFYLCDPPPQKCNFIQIVNGMRRGGDSQFGRNVAHVYNFSAPKKISKPAAKYGVSVANKGAR